MLAPKIQPVKLSICIATYNRGPFIAMTLDSILPQLTQDVELVVVDGASPDNTSEVMAAYVSQHPHIRYYREEVNSGVDQDYDKTVNYANGEYCWLMTDDDLIVPNAVSRILDALKDGLDLVVVNSEVCNVDFSEILEPRLLNIARDNEYIEGKHESLFAEVGSYLSFIGGVIVRRAFWLGRDRVSYYGTLFVHFGVIFQSPPIRAVRVIADPLIKIRYGNAMWTARGFEIWMFKWPELVWSFQGISDESKRLVCPRRPYLEGKKLFLYRAIGGYSVNEYSRFLSISMTGLKAIRAYAIAICPAVLSNFISAVYCVINRKNTRTGMYNLVRSPHANWATRVLARLMGVPRS